MVDGVGDWDPIAAALLADDPSAITHPRGRSFRAFADQTRSDRRALAACISTSRQILTEEDMSRITQPTLVAVGTTDDIGGSPEELAALMPNATPFAIEGRDHMLAVGDRTFKKRVLEFYAEHPLA
jgi:pimeloyl-ACP methyl ester carboxylesterase